MRLDDVSTDDDLVAALVRWSNGRGGHGDDVHLAGAARRARARAGAHRGLRVGPARRARGAAAIGASGLLVTGGGSALGWRRHLPFAVLIAALAVMIFALSRPQATLATSKPTGTVLLVVDVSNSMGADDVEPNRLAVAQQAARDFVEAQPSTIEIGLVAFGNGALSPSSRPTAAPTCSPPSTGSRSAGRRRSARACSPG